MYGCARVPESGDLFSSSSASSSSAAPYALTFCPSAHLLYACSQCRRLVNTHRPDANTSSPRGYGTTHSCTTAAPFHDRYDSLTPSTRGGGMCRTSRSGRDIDLRELARRWRIQRRHRCSRLRANTRSTYGARRHRALRGSRRSHRLQSADSRFFVHVLTRQVGEHFLLRLLAHRHVLNK